jgi:hypothetical protein
MRANRQAFLFRKTASWIAFSLALCAAAFQDSEAQAPSNVKRVILMDHSVSGGHVSSRKYLREALARLSEQHGFQLRITQNPAEINARNLESAQILIFSSGDGDVLPPGPGREAVENFVKIDGKGLILIHAAAAFIKDWAFLKEAVVEQYHRHYPETTIGIVYADSGTPGSPDHGLNNAETREIFSGLRRTARLMEDFYSFKKNPRETPGVNVLISLDETSLYKRNLKGDHPLVWTRRMGNGIALTHTLGHMRGSFTVADSFGQRLLWSEMRYVAGDWRPCAGNREAGQPCLGKEAMIPEIRFLPTRISILNRAVRISVGPPGEHRIQVVNAAGRKVFNAVVTGPGRAVVTPRLGSGIYHVEVISRTNEKVSKKVALP